MKLSTAEARRQKQARAQRIEDILYLKTLGIFVPWVALWVLIGQAAIKLQHQMPHPTTSDFTIVAGTLFIGSLIGIGASVHHFQKLLWKGSRLEAEVLALAR